MNHTVGDTMKGNTHIYSTTKIIGTINLIGAFVVVTLSPTARAVIPPPDGGYPGSNLR